MFVANGKTRTRSTSLSPSAILRCDRLFEPFENLDGLLQAAAATLAENFSLQRCVITWVAEDRITMSVRAKASRNGVLQYAAENDAERATETERFVASAAEAGNGGAGETKNGVYKLAELTLPLRINEHIIGYVCFVPSSSAQQFAEHDLELMQAHCALLARAIEFAQMRQMLASRLYVTAADKAARREHGNVPALEARVLQAVQNPERIARIIARSFYKELRNAGFAAKQILLIASEIIAHLNAGLHKTKAKIK